MKRVINNGLTGSSWYFNRFNYINIKIIPRLLTTWYGKMCDFVDFEAIDEEGDFAMANECETVEEEEEREGE